jgi:hypothetical protein
MTEMVSMSAPSGYRMPVSTSLSGLARLLTNGGRAIRRELMVSAVARVAAELVRDPAGEDALFEQCSQGQVAARDLSITSKQKSGVLLRAAEFVDAVNAYGHRVSAVPIPASVDLSFSVQFFDDPSAQVRDWTYALVTTQCDPLHQAWQGIRGVESFPVATRGESPELDTDYEGWAARVDVWERVLRPFHRSAPLRWDAPDSAVLFDLTESGRRPDLDAALAADGAPTVSAVTAEVRRLLGPDAPADLEDRLR